MRNQFRTGTRRIQSNRPWARLVWLAMTPGLVGACSGETQFSVEQDRERVRLPEASAVTRASGDAGQESSSQAEQESFEGAAGGGEDEPASAAQRETEQPEPVTGESVASVAAQGDDGEDGDALGMADVVIGSQLQPPVTMVATDEIAAADVEAQLGGQLVPTRSQPDLVTTTDVFNLESTQAEVRMIWAVDSSGSMSNEVDSVRDNLSAFLSYLEGRTQVKLAIIADRDLDSNGFRLADDQIAKGYVQVDQRVNSENALVCTSRALGVADALDGLPDRTTNLDPESKDCRMKTPSLAGFFQPNARNVLVTVSDDVSAMPTEEFTRRLSRLVPPSTFAFFGFVGLKEKESCDIAAVGTMYKELAHQTGGMAFDVCEKDWTTHFARLAESVARLARSQFTLVQTQAVRIDAVSIDGKLLAPEQYRLEGNQLLIVPAAIQPAVDKSVSVTYVHQPSAEMGTQSAFP